MQASISGQANVLYYDMVAKSDGGPITSGTVNVYLIAASGTNAGKWFRASDDTWQAAEASAGAATHKASGHWLCSITSDAWDTGVLYVTYAKESGDLHIDYSESVVCDRLPTAAELQGKGGTTFTYTLTDADSGNPIADADVWVTTDEAGDNDPIGSGRTDQNGQVVFLLDAGTVYVWRQKTGYNFDNPDTEVIT